VQAKRQPARGQGDDLTLRGCYSPKLAADYLSISQAELYKLLAQGDIKSWKYGKLRRISRAALDEWIASREAESEAS
jgi:excisionase family DNA binding protein